MKKNLQVQLRRWCCALLLGLVALVHSGCTLTLPLSLLTLLVRNDTAPDANAIVLARPSQPAKPMQPQAEMTELPSLRIDEGVGCDASHLLSYSPATAPMSLQHKNKRCNTEAVSKRLVFVLFLARRG